MGYRIILLILILWFAHKKLVTPWKIRYVSDASLAAGDLGYRREHLRRASLHTYHGTDIHVREVFTSSCASRRQKL